MDDFDVVERELTEGLARVGAAARPPDDAWERFVRRLDSRPAGRTDSHRGERDPEVVMLTPNRHDIDARRWVLIAVAAAAAALLIGALIGFADLRGDTAPADEPSPGVTTVPDGQDGDEVQDDRTPDVSIAEQFVSALGAADVDTATALVATDAEIQHYGQSGTHAEIAVGIALEEATGGRTVLQSCESTAPNQVRCDASYINDRVSAVGGVPAPMTFFVRTEHGMITAFRVALDTSGFGNNPWEDDKAFVADRDADDFAAMFASHPDGMGIVGPLLTEESVELHRRYTDDFIADLESET